MSDRFDETIAIPSVLEVIGSSGVSKDNNGFWFSATNIDIAWYDIIIVCLSGGKDSIACLLHLIDAGVDMHRVELWHHDVDGRDGSTLMDWPFMADYNRKLAQAFNLPLYFSWLEGGFETELLKHNGYSRPHNIETPEGLITLSRDLTRTKPATRLRFPQVSANLQTRWCSSALKIDVGRRALNNQLRFDGKKILFITGERREESGNRAKYNQLEPHACDRRNGRKARHVDAWRPIIDWTEEQVWDALERHKVIAPVPYRLGWSRSSCMSCIFNDPIIWATIAKYFPEHIKVIAGYEQQFGVSISRSKKNVIDIASSAKPVEIEDAIALAQAKQREYTLPVFHSENDGIWQMPLGAFRKERSGAQ